MASLRFVVFDYGDRAEAYRTSRGSIPPKRAVLAGGARAMELATGCSVASRTLRGDQAVVKARLDCKGRPSLDPDLLFIVLCTSVSGPRDTIWDANCRLDGARLGYE
ncbi:MAG: hypothetical protein AAFR35_06690 [Pseudomonadota bacterium]